MVRSSTTTGSDAVYMTDDLEGRLDEDSLVTPAKEAVGEMNKYIESGLERPVTSTSEAFPVVDVALELVFADDTRKRLDGVATAISFGEGWMLTVEVNMSAAVEVVKQAARQKLILTRVTIDGATFALEGELDCALSFSYGACSFTVSADVGSYVEA